MEDQLVSFETAKLAKEKGFDKRCIYFYTPDGHALHQVMIRSLYECNAPTQSLLQKWLRETHKIEFIIKPFHDGSLHKTTYVADPINILTGKSTRIARQDTYEKALEIGLQEGLKLIIQS